MRPSRTVSGVLRKAPRDRFTAFRIARRSLVTPLGGACDHIDDCVLGDSGHGEGFGGRVDRNLFVRADLGHRVCRGAAGGDDRMEHGDSGHTDRIGVQLELRGPHNPEQGVVLHGCDGNGRNKRLG